MAFLLRNSHFQLLCSRKRRGVLNAEPYTAEEQELALDILDYLCENQEAKDTLKGIPHWLKDSSAVINAAKIERAISFLLSNQLVLKTLREGLQPLYCMNDRKRDEILTLIKNRQK